MAVFCWGRCLRTCKNVSEGVSARDLQSWMFGSKDIQEKRGQAAQNTQEAESSDDPQEENRLGVDAEF